MVRKSVVMGTLFLSLLAPSALQGKVLRTVHLTVEGRVQPIGIDMEQPRFGWQIESDGRNVMQRAYHILVASSRERLDRDEADVWDSREVKSEQAQWIPLPKTVHLVPGKEYYWKVQVKTNKGKISWSQPSRWSTGLMGADSWRGQWIGLDSLMSWDKMERHSRISARYLRKEFAARQKRVARATLYISGLGYYALYLNGHRVGQDVLTPLPTDYTKTVAYDTYDVTSLLSRVNTMGVVLEGGHYFAQTQNFQPHVRTSYGLPRLLANLVVEYADGVTDTVATDESWRVCADGPVRYANEYDGECYDANRQVKGWNCVGFDDSRWMKPQVMKAPGGTLRGGLAPNMTVYQTEKPLSIHRFGQRCIVDFGTNNAGRIHIRLPRSVKGDTIRIRHAELLQQGDSLLYVDNLRSAEATALYVGDGQPVDWSPEFTYYGFRYVEVTGVDGLTPADIRRELIADRMDDSHTGLTVTDSQGRDMLDSILANARRGVRSNYKGIPVDCPQRDERMPWLGDRTTGCLGESYLMNNHDIYAKWVRDICDSQDADGRISDVSPAYWRLYNTNVTWPAALPFACDMLYRQYGDLKPMAECYASIKRFLEMVHRENYKDGLVPYDRYGDWCVPPESPRLVHSKDPTRQTDGQLLSSAYYFYLCRMMARYAGLLGYGGDVSHFTEEASVTAKAINKTYLKDGHYGNATATANLLPLAMGIVPDSVKETVARNLLTTITDKNDTHISSGVIGIQWLMRGLSEIGHGDVAYRMAVTDTYPGWGYMVKNGATTIWELWNGNTANPSMNSGNHVMLLGDLLPWCYEYLGGIRPDAECPGFKHIILRPDFGIKDVSGVKASHPSPYGVIHSQYVRHEDVVEWRVDIPANTTADVYLPDGRVRKIGSGQWTFKTKQRNRIKN